MNRNTGKRSRREQQMRVSRKLMIAFAVLLLIGAIAQITMIARLSGQNKAVRAVEKEIRLLSAEADNLNLALNQLGNLDRVERQAEKLGMVTPGEGQIRVVNLPDAVDSTSAQSAGNTSAEESRE